MTMNPLPPQAYTKDTLLKAYHWLTVQSPSIKEMAHSPDILVSLYLKATRDGDSALERPSIKNFKSELKSLAGMMGELDRPHNAHPNQAPAIEPQQAPQQAYQQPRQQQQQSSLFNSHQSPPPMMETTTQTLIMSQQTATPVQGLDFLDAATRSMIHEVKESLNLSSDMEALRMLVKIGYTRSKGLV